MKYKKILLVLISFFISAKLLATNYYVDAYTGSDTNPGTSWSEPFKTIQHAVNIASSGDTILVNEGVYGEKINMRGKANLLIRAVGRVILKSAVAVGFDLTLTRNITIDGFIIKDGGVSAYYGPGFNYNNVIKNCVLSAIVANASKFWIIERNVIYKEPKNEYTGGGIQLLSVSNMIIRNNTISYHNNGIQVGNSTYRYNPNIIIENNIIYKNNVGVNVYENSWVGEIDYNDVYGNGTDYSGVSPGPHDLSVDPQFIDAENRIFYLEPTSPLINAGSLRDGYYQTIGALGIGIYQGIVQANPWDGWYYDPALVEKDDSGYLKLRDGVASAVVLSPVYDIRDLTGRNRSPILKAIFPESEEFYPIGSGAILQVIDYDPSTIQREIRWRGSKNSFDQTAPTPDWHVALKTEKINFAGYNYVQIEYVLRHITQ